MAGEFPADVRNDKLLYATGDCVGFMAALGTAAPNAFEDLDPDVWNCLGWLDVAGYTFKPTLTLKEVPAAGTLSSIRTVITGGNKEFNFIALEALNPFVRALYDDVPPTDLQPSAPRTDTGCATTSSSGTVTDAAAVSTDLGQPVTCTTSGKLDPAAVITAVSVGVGYTVSPVAIGTGTGLTFKVGLPNTVSYVLPERPTGNRYAFCFDTWDGDKRIRAFAPNGMATARGDEVMTQADIDMLNMTLGLYPDDINITGGGTERGTIKRYVDYGSVDVSGYFA